MREKKGSVFRDFALAAWKKGKGNYWPGAKASAKATAERGPRHRAKDSDKSNGEKQKSRETGTHFFVEAFHWSRGQEVG